MPYLASVVEGSFVEVRTHNGLLQTVLLLLARVSRDFILVNADEGEVSLMVSNDHYWSRWRIPKGMGTG